jgi:DNA-binding HxlR family transcriptional regulator
MGRKFRADPTQMRAGAHLLAMATNRINRGILRRLNEESMAWGAGREMKITDTGKEMLFVSFVGELWLQSGPRGAIDPDSDEAEATIAALVEGWSATLVHALAHKPMTLEEVDQAIDGIGRAELRRRLEDMHKVGLIEARPEDGGSGATYSVTEWLRTGIAPLSVAARLERRDPGEEMTPIDGFDVETAFLLTLPLLELPPDVAGSCRIGVEVIEKGQTRMVGAMAQVEGGRVASCSVELEDRTDAWAMAGPGEWLDTVIAPSARRVLTGGDRLLARVLLDGLHQALFGVPVLKTGPIPKKN